MPVLYNITIHVEKSVERSWYHWLLDTHIPAILKSGHFDSYRLSKLTHPQEVEGVTYSIQFKSPSMPVLSAFIQTEASQRAHELRRLFGDSCVQFTTIMELLREEQKN